MRPLPVNPRRTIGGPSVAPNSGEHWRKEAAPAVPFREDVVNHINEAAESAWQAAQRLAGDQRYTWQHRNEGVNAILQAAQDEIEARHTVLAQRLEAERLKLEQQGQMSIVPSPDEIPQLNYTHDALAVAWKGMSLSQFLAGWQQAIDSKDRVVSRVYRDFSGTQFKGKRGELLAGEQRATLSVATDDLLMPDSVRQSRQEYQLVTETQFRAGIARSAALSRVQNGYLDNASKLQSKSAALRQARIRD